MSFYHDEIRHIALEHDLILLDLDNVVITPKQYLCGSIWHEHYCYENKGNKNPQQLVQDFYDYHSEYGPVSRKLVDDFSGISSNKMVLGFTSRMIEYAPDVLAIVERVGMKFTSTDFINHPNIKNGIIFVGHDLATAKPKNKGALLRELLSNKVLGNIKSIMWIDDALKNLTNVRSELGENIIFTGIYYKEVKSKLLCEVGENDLHDLGIYQMNFYKNYGYIPSNQNYLSFIWRNVTCAR